CPFKTLSTGFTGLTRYSSLAGIRFLNLVHLVNPVQYGQAGMPVLLRMKTILRSIGFLSLTLVIATVICQGQETASQPTPKIETTYDSAEDRTTIRLAPVLVAIDQGKYR